MARPPGARPPNVIVVLIDALRADRLGTYGYERQLSPAIDALAAEGAVFDQAISQAPWTQPSVASIFCSFYPSVHQVATTSSRGTARSSTRHRPGVQREFHHPGGSAPQNGYETAAFWRQPIHRAAVRLRPGLRPF